MNDQSNLPTIAPERVHELMERLIVKGDTSRLNPLEKSQFYTAVCESLGLNPLTKPFEFIMLGGKEVLYARKDATDQLRKKHGVSVLDMTEAAHEGLTIVTVKVQDKSGRTDMAKGAVSLVGLRGEALANAIMKAETKAKRRATLSICGLGFLDETDVETIPNARPAEEVIEQWGERRGEELIKAVQARPEPPVEIWDDAPEPETDWDKLGPVKQAGVLCSDPAFIKFLAETEKWNTGTAAEYVRARCAIKSRKELATNDAAMRKWGFLVAEFRAWQREPAVVDTPHSHPAHAADTEGASATDHAPHDAEAGAPKVLSLQEEAREAAKRGNKVFMVFYRRLDVDKQKALLSIGEELRSLMDRAGA
jgi:hypothetical protein